MRSADDDALISVTNDNDHMTSHQISVVVVDGTSKANETTRQQQHQQHQQQQDDDDDDEDEDIVRLTENAALTKLVDRIAEDFIERVMSHHDMRVVV